MKYALLAIITLLPTYLIRFHIGAIPTTLLEILLLSTFLFWCLQKIIQYTKERSGAIPLSGVDDGSGHGVLRPRSEDERRRKAVSDHAGEANEARGNAQGRSFILPIILFILAGIISIFIAPDTRAALGLFRAYIIEPILFFIMFTDTLNHSPRSGSGQAGWPTVWHDVTIALSLSALGVALPAIYQEWNPIGIPNIHWAAAETRRVTSWYGFPNAIGLFLAPLIPFFVAQLFKKQKLLARGYWLVATIASLAAIVFAHSEGALFALAFVTIIAGPAHERTRLWTATLALLFALAIFYNPGWYSYMHDQLTLQNDSGKVRRIQWQETAQMLRDISTPLGAGRPLLGAGLAGYPKTFAPYHKATYIEIYQYPHNILLNFWSELGLLGLLSFFWLIVVFYKKILYHKKSLEIRNWKLEIAALAAMAIILIHGLVDVPYFKNDLAIFFWLLLALTFTHETPMVMDTEKK
ncbi:O-antigen ligase family protein [Candidatus Uhrbacteria bacterium]|nr:O-antigen ligase family protein [Candidatus Uhrbacteria bacterium]